MSRASRKRRQLPPLDSTAFRLPPICRKTPNQQRKTEEKIHSDAFNLDADRRLGSGAFADDSGQGAIPQVPPPGMVTLADLGTDKCNPCKMMAPILAELNKEYTSRASIIFIDVWEHRRQAMRFAVRAIPTRIFHDATGQEALRHVGSMDKKSIVATFAKLGVPARRDL